jgi:hypothetical protein
VHACMDVYDIPPPASPPRSQRDTDMHTNTLLLHTHTACLLLVVVGKDVAICAAFWLVVPPSSCACCLVLSSGVECVRRACVVYVCVSVCEWICEMTFACTSKNHHKQAQRPGQNKNNQVLVVVSHTWREGQNKKG